MTIVGLDVLTFVIVVALMTACAGGIGRLLWLLEGRPPLDRPSWWPGAAGGKVATAGGGPSAADATAAAPPAAPPRRLAVIGACAVCCGAPLLVLAGVVSVGVAGAVSVTGGLLVLAALVGWATLTGRVGHRRGSRPADRDSTTVAPVSGSGCAAVVAAERAGDGLA